MKIAVVGSRERNKPEDKKAVEDFIDSLQECDIVVSGGCRGVDSWAITRAIKRGLVTEIHFPNIEDDMDYGDRVDEYYARNRKVVDNSDVVYAFPIDEKRGGTGYTIKYARERGKQVILK
jgi:predicted Rossmann fold nucleotide-binding protein DprA/Smf involved in DNA uptake